MQNYEPNKGATDFQEKCAASITQNVLFNNRSKIQKYLIPVPT